MSNEIWVQHAVAALEGMAEVASDLFQARKIGMQVIIPEEVESAYVLKHGKKGKNFLNMLRGDVIL